MAGSRGPTHALSLGRAPRRRWPGHLARTRAV